ncbi:MAG: polysaccharide deacetylase family protein [Methylococcaceae bacterium]|nr:polysaccharide deacetylase family protein [Methylococcaceae bacterium]
MDINYNFVSIIDICFVGMLISLIVCIVFFKRMSRSIPAFPIVYSEKKNALVQAVVTDNFSSGLTSNKSLPRRKLMHTFIVVIIGIQGFHLLTTYANAANLIPNPSVESANAAGTLPLSWQTGKSGINTTTYTYKTNDGHTGAKSLYVDMTRRSYGNAYWYSTPVVVKPNTKYTYSEFYKSNVNTQIDIENINTRDNTSTSTAVRLEASATTWTPVTFSFKTPSNIKQVIIIHRNIKVGWLQTDDFSLVETSSPNAPTVSIISPAAGAIVSGVQAINVAAGDAVGVTGVQLNIDGINFGPEDTAAPYSTNWDTTGLQNCSSHSITATARNTSNLTATASETVTVRNGATLSITAPAAGTVVGAVPFTATATGACALLGVQFQVDGVNVGVEDTNAPYSVNLNTATLTNGSHTLTAIGRDSGGTTTATQTIQVNNSAPSACVGNLIPNSSVETASGGLPTDWVSISGGTNTRTFSYLNTGHSGSHSLNAQITAFTNGYAGWSTSRPQPVTPGHYQYTGWYQSNVETEVVAEFTMSDGSVQSYYLGYPMAFSIWKQFRAELDVPQGAVSVTIYHVIYSVGTLTTDDFCFAPYTPAQFNRPLVSVTYDDGDANQYANAYPLHLTRGVPATFYIISGELNNLPTYMTAAQILDLHAHGMEIGSHSATHSDTTTLSSANLVNEMSQSQSTLQSTIGALVTDFSAPYGAYNQNTIAVGQQYYQSQRTVDSGFNNKDNFDPTRLKIQEVYNGVTPIQVKFWINQAISEKSWLILVYHRIDPNTQPLPKGDLYSILPSELDEVLTYLKSSGAAAITVDKAIKEIFPQL